jgi:AcrR family transcriptional regulator
VSASRAIAHPPGSVLGQRRAPMQRRSSQRLDQILAAAAALVDEAPYDDITTGLIAARADVAIGSVYRFFDDKAAIYRALSVRHFETYVEELQSALADRSFGALADWSQLLDLTIDCYVEMVRSTPGFRGFGDVIDVHLLDAERDNDTVLADRLLDLLHAELSIRPTASLRLALLVAVTAADSLLALAFRRDTDGDQAVIAETKAVVRSYLAPHFDSTKQ